MGLSGLGDLSCRMAPSAQSRNFASARRSDAARGRRKRGLAVSSKAGSPRSRSPSWRAASTRPIASVQGLIDGRSTFRPRRAALLARRSEARNETEALLQFGRSSPSLS